MTSFLVRVELNVEGWDGCAFQEDRKTTMPRKMK